MKQTANDEEKKLIFLSFRLSSKFASHACSKPKQNPDTHTTIIMWAAMTRSIEMIVALIEYYSGTVVNASIAVDNTGGGSHLHEQYTLRYGRSNSLTLHPPKFIDSTRSYAQRRVFFLNFCVLMPSAGPLTLTPQSWFISATLTQPRHIIHPPPTSLPITDHHKKPPALAP